MARKPTNSHSRIVLYTSRARTDLFEAQISTHKKWGSVQASAYRIFLRDFVRDLADHPTTSPFVDNYPGIRSAIARWPGARDGHRVFFKETDTGILVLRVLHTAMNWQDHLSDA